MPRAKSSRSPLANPQTLIHKLATNIQEHLHLPNPTPFYITYGAVAANMMTGHPVWLMLVGPGGVGKGRPIDAIDGLPRIFKVGAIEGSAGLMSGSSKKDKVKGATGGLILEIGQRGIIAPKDFTSTLSQEPHQLGRAISALREISDGQWSRPLGTDGGRRFVWEGQIGFIGACTNVLDRHHRTIGELGQRWIIFRFDETDGYHESVKAMGSDRSGSMLELRRHTQEFFDALCLEFSCYPDCHEKMRDQNHRCSTGPAKRALTSRELNRIIAMGTLSARARSIVPRDDKTDDIIDLPSREPPTRLNEALGQLFLGLELIGLPEDERWDLIGKVAWDSISPQMRSVLLKALWQLPVSDGMSLKQAEETLGVSPRTMKKVVGDLKVLGMLEFTGANQVRLTKWTLEQLGGMV